MGPIDFGNQVAVTAAYIPQGDDRVATRYVIRIPADTYRSLNRVLQSIGQGHTATAVG